MTAGSASWGFARADVADLALAGPGIATSLAILLPLTALAYGLALRPVRRAVEAKQRAPRQLVRSDPWPMKIRASLWRIAAECA
jgi:hypothetical protein